MLGIIPTFDCT